MSEWTYLAVAALPDEDIVLEPLEGDHWGPEALRAWEAWSRSPITCYWTSGDQSFALDTLSLYSDFARHANRISGRMDRLGLTPAGLRKLRFRPLA